MSVASEVQESQAVPKAVPDQITKEPTGPPAKVKDPKKVRAEKALAQKNREARAAQAALEAKGEEKEEGTDFLSGIQIAASAVGAGFVLWHGWQAASPFLEGFVKGMKKKTSPYHSTFEEEEDEPPSPPPPPTNTQSQTQKHEEAVLLMD